MAWLRNTMGALVLCGIPDEKHWPYTDASPDFDEEPLSFVYSLVDDLQAVWYFCHDPLGSYVSGEAVLASVKKYLGAGIPSIFGFWGSPSCGTGKHGEIHYPCPGESAQWSHAFVAVGYGGAKKIKNVVCGKTTIGALLIHNSWGTGWGDKGYGWLPYDYVVNKLALRLLASSDKVEGWS